MKYLFPILGLLLAFFAGRMARPKLESIQDTAASIEASAHTRSQGLAARAEALAAREDMSAASLEKAWRSGNLSATDLQSQILQLAEKNPAAAFDWVESAELGSGTESGLLSAVISAWFAKDPEAAFARMSAFPYTEASSMAGGLLGLLQAGTPEQKAAVVRHLDALMAMIGGFSPAGIPAATAENGEMLLALPASQGRDALLRHFTNSWLEQDPAAAAKWLAKLPAAVRDEAMERHAERVLHPKATASEESRKLASAWLLKEASPSTRARLGPLFAEYLAKDDPAAAMTWASKNLAAEQLASATGKIIAQVAAKSPEEARGLAEGLPPGTLRNQAAYHVAEALMATDPNAAIAWYLSKVNLRVADMQSLNSLGTQWATKQPDSFRAFMADPASPELPAHLLFPGISGMMASDKEACLEWIATLPASRRNAVSKAAYESWSRDAPAAAAAGFDARPDLATPEAAKQIAVNWYRKDPKATIGWLAALPWGGPREAALAGVKRLADFEVELGGSFPEDLRALIR